MSKTYETTSCGYALKFAGPETIEAYDAKVGKQGASLEHACLYTIYRDTLLDWQEAFASVLQERTGIARGVDQEATATAKAKPERLTSYNKRVVSEWADGDKEKRDQLQQWAQETADKIELAPRSAPVPGTKTTATTKADLAKAQQILSQDSEYIEERVTLMLADIPDYELSRDAAGKPDAESLARLIHRYIVAKLKL